MDKYVTLLGTDKVMNASNTMIDAAARMQEAATIIDEANRRQREFLDDWIMRFCDAIQALPAPTGGEESGT